MRISTWRIIKLVAIGIMMTTAACYSAWQLPDSVSGTWTGKCRIFCPKSSIVTTGSVDSVDVFIQIHPDQTVTGKVGDADFTTCVVKKNRGWLGRKLNFKSDYIISGKITRGIYLGDPESERNFTIPFNIKNKKLKSHIMVLHQWKYPDPLVELRLVKK